MYYRRTLTQSQINQELLGTVLSTPLWWVVLVSILGVIVAGAVSAAGFMFNQGPGSHRAEPTGVLGLLHHQLRVLGRHQPCRRHDFRHPPAQPSRVAASHGASRRDHDGVRPDDVAADAPPTRGAPLAHLLLGLPLRLGARHLAGRPLPACLGPYRHHDLSHFEHVVRLYGADPRPRHHPRPEHRLAQAHLRHARARMARQSPPVEDAGHRRHPAVGAHPARLRLCPQHRLLGLRRQLGAVVARHGLRALLRHRPRSTPAYPPSSRS